MKQVAFIGIGVMGRSMAGHLLSGGYELHVYSRTKSKAEPLLAQGAHWHDTIAQCVNGCQAVVTMVGFPQDVEQVYFGPEGILENAAPGTLLIDMTTTDPALAVRIHQRAAQRSLLALDAPVSGGDVGAKNATLSIMAGGDAAGYEQALPLFRLLGKSMAYTGAAGTGQHTKMANQIAICGAIAGVCEAMTYGKANGLDLTNMLSCISGGAAGSWQMNNMAPRMLKGDFAPGFFIKHQVKDLRLALSGAEAAGLDLPVLAAVKQMYETLEAEGEGELGTQALIHFYEKENRTSC